MNAGTTEREHALERVEAGADRDWMVAADLAIVACVAAGRPFTTDRVWALLARDYDVHTPEPRAMGAAMRRAQGRGLIEATDRVVPSIRPGCHRRPIRVWQPIVEVA